MPIFSFLKNQFSDGPRASVPIDLPGQGRAVTLEDFARIPRLKENLKKQAQSAAYADAYAKAPPIPKGLSGLDLRKAQLQRQKLIEQSAKSNYGGMYSKAGGLLDAYLSTSPTKDVGSLEDAYAYARGNLGVPSYAPAQDSGEAAQQQQAQPQPQEQGQKQEIGFDPTMGALDPKALYSDFKSIDPNKNLPSPTNLGFTPAIADEANAIMRRAGADKLEFYGGPGTRFQAAARAKTFLTIIKGLMGEHGAQDKTRLSARANDINNSRSNLSSIIGNSQNNMTRRGKALLDAQVRAASAATSKGRKGGGKQPSFKTIKEIISALEVGKDGKPVDPAAYEAAQITLSSMPLDSPVMRRLATNKLLGKVSGAAKEASPYGTRFLPWSDSAGLRDFNSALAKSPAPVRAASNYLGVSPSLQAITATSPINGVAPEDVPPIPINQRDVVDQALVGLIGNKQVIRR